MPRFFKSMPPAAVGETVELVGQDAVHIGRSLRLKVGDAVLLCDGKSTEYDTVIENVTASAVTLRVESVRPSKAEPSVAVTLYQGLPKGDKMEWIIQKAVELGVTRIVPVETARSVARLGEKADKKQARWQAIASAAAEQSGRGALPEVAAPRAFKEALADMAGEPLIVCYEGGGQPLPALVSPDMKRLSLFIGPEGGIAPDEMEALTGIGGQAASLGPRILRCETAPLAALAVVMAQTGNMQDTD